MDDDQVSLTCDEEDATPSASDKFGGRRSRLGNGGRTPQTPGCGGYQCSTSDAGGQVARAFQDRSGYRVFVRVRTSPKSQAREPHAVEVVGTDGLRVERGASSPDLELRFDGVLGSQAGQADVFDSLRGAVATVLEGRSCTVLAYGQTGSGKTHTIVGQVTEEGDQSEAIKGPQRGLISRALEQLFEWISPQDGHRGARALTPGRRRFGERPKGWRVYLSFLEIYNERVYDLLAGASGNLTRGGSSMAGLRTARGEFGRQGNFSRRGDSAPHLDVREDRAGGVIVPGATIVEVTAVEQALEVLRIGTACRTVGHNGVNATSSRSHAVFQVRLKQIVDPPGGHSQPVEQVSKLNLVDLAGSEKMQYNSATSGVMLQELTCINLSLSAIGQCIAALVNKKRTHVPYRDSKLTRLLQDSLRGDCMCIMWICISPTQSSMEETLSSLKFADRAKRAVLERPKPIPAQASLPKGTDSSQRTIDELLSKMQELHEELHEERLARAKLEAIVRRRSSSADCLVESQATPVAPSPSSGPLGSPGMLASSMSGSSLGASACGSRSLLFHGGKLFGARGLQSSQGSSSHLGDLQITDDPHVPSRMTELAEQNQAMLARLEALEGGVVGVNRDLKSPGVTSTASLGSTSVPSTMASYAASPPCNPRQERDLPMAWVHTGGNGVEEFFKAAVSRTKAASIANLQEREAQAHGSNEEFFKAAASKTKANVRDRLETHRQSTTNRIIHENATDFTDGCSSPGRPRRGQDAAPQSRNIGGEGLRSPCYHGGTKGSANKSSGAATARPSSAGSTQSTRCPSSVGSCRSFSSATKTVVGGTRPSSTGKISGRHGTASSKLRRSLVEDLPYISHNEELAAAPACSSKSGDFRGGSSSEGRFSQRRSLSGIHDVAVDPSNIHVQGPPVAFRKTSMSPPRCGRMSPADEASSPGFQGSETDNDRVFGDGRRSSSRGPPSGWGGTRGISLCGGTGAAAAAAAAFLNDSVESSRDRGAPLDVRTRKEQDRASLIRLGRDVLGALPKSTSICSEEASSVVDELFSPSKTNHSDSDFAISSRSPSACGGGARFSCGFGGCNSPARSTGSVPSSAAAAAAACFGGDDAAGAPIASQLSPVGSPMAAPAVFLNNLLASGTAGSRRTSPAASGNNLRGSSSTADETQRSLRDILGSLPVCSPGLEAMRRVSPSPPHRGAQTTEQATANSSRAGPSGGSNASRCVSLEILSGSEASSSSRFLVNATASSGVASALCSAARCAALPARTKVLRGAPVESIGGRHSGGPQGSARLGASSAITGACALWDADSDEDRVVLRCQPRARAASAGRVGNLSPWAGR